jgi:hypothetical protein
MPKNEVATPGFFIATRFPFQSYGYAGFDWSGQGRGLNTLTAWVDILEAEFDKDGNIESFAVDFTQFEVQRGILNVSLEENRWAFGSFRFNSEYPIVPEPSSFILSLASLFALLIPLKR